MASKKHQSRFSGLVRGTHMPFLFLCSKPGQKYRFGKRNHYPILIPKILVISHPRFKPDETGLPYSPIPIFEQLSNSHPSPSQSWSCRKINQILLKSSESKNDGINSSIIATKITTLINQAFNRKGITEYPNEGITNHPKRRAMKITNIN